jgi:hypothetical protein
MCINVSNPDDNPLSHYQSDWLYRGDIQARLV